MSEKGNRLTGGALTGEVIDSSRKVLTGGRGGVGVGLQQFFTPPEVGRMLAKVFDPEKATLDPTAGNGALLGWVRPEQRYGMEIDRDQITAGNYQDNSIAGDLQKVYPLLRGVGATWPQLVVNPPFGLEWGFPGIDQGKRGSSTLRAFQLTCKLLDPISGQAAFICGSDRYEREIAGLEEAGQVWARIEVTEMFEGVDLSCMICLLVGEYSVKENTSQFQVTVTVDELEDLAFSLQDERADRTNWRDTPARFANTGVRPAFQAAGNEHRRRSEGQQRKGYDLSLNGQKLRVRLGDYSKVALAQIGHKAIEAVRNLNGLALSWVALNPKNWREIRQYAEDGALTIEPALLDRIETVAGEVKAELVPLYQVRPQQRLGYLDDLEQITCIKSCPINEFEEGVSYPISTQSKIDVVEEERPYERLDGEMEVRKFKTSRRVLEILIHGKEFSESAEHVNYLLEHFEMPDPGDIGDRYPEQVERARQILDQLTERHNWKEKELDWKGLEDPETGEWVPWQKEDIARAIVKGRAVLGWEQGGGKSLGLLALALGSIEFHRLPRQAMLCVPQDLIPQWQREARRFFDLEFEKIDTPAKARDVRRRMRQGEEGFFITWYEALSLTGAVDEALPEGRFKVPRQVYDPATGGPATKLIEYGSDEACPGCGALAGDQWLNNSCRSCGYVHKSRKVHSIGKHLSTAFKDGVVCVDELSLVRGIDSKRGKAVRSLRAKCRFAGSGTPIANYVSDAFNGLGWVCGLACTRFPYEYDDRSAWESSFAVIEEAYGAKDSDKANVVQRRKVLPKVTNVSQLWRLLAASMVRRRQEHMGQLVERTDVKVEVPMGTVQRRLHHGWLEGFADWFTLTYPDHSLVQAGAVERFAPAIGQLAKLEAVATLPVCDPHTEYAAAQFTEGREISPWTPAILKTLELAMEHVRKGDKVLIGSSRVDTGHFLAERLKERGVRASHIVEEKKDGGFATKNPKRRARLVQEFAEGNGQVLAVGIESMKLGHDLAAASCAIVIGHPWSHESLAQYCRRVHRLSSKKPVSIYSIVTRGTLAEKKHKLLMEKSAAADLALDGQLVDDEEEPINWTEQLKEMREAGFQVSEEDTLDELDIEALWDRAEGPFEPILAPPRPASWGPVNSDPEPEVEEKPFTPFALSVPESDEDNGQLGFDF